MKLFIALLAVAVTVVGCDRRSRYNPVPPATHEKKPIIDLAPEDTSSRMEIRTLYLKKRVAVARFGDVGEVEGAPFQRDERLVEQAGGPGPVTEMLINGLHVSGRFDIVERKDIETVLREMEFGESQWTDKASAAKAGKVLGAQCIIFPTAGWDLDANNAPTGAMLVFLRMVDVSTSRVTASVMGIGGDLHSAITQAVIKLTKESESSPWVGKIAKVSPGEIVIDCGKDLGVVPGDTFAVFSLGEAVKAPDSDRILGYREVGAGVIEITEVKESFSVAKPVTLTREVKPGDLIRPAIEK